jgi:hypothetical protein
MGRNSARRGVDEMLANGDASCGIASIQKIGKKKMARIVDSS